MPHSLEKKRNIEKEDKMTSDAHFTHLIRISLLKITYFLTFLNLPIPKQFNKVYLKTPAHDNRNLSQWRGGMLKKP